MLAVVVALCRGADDPVCSYTAHPGTTYLGPGNVIGCADAEGLSHCRGRCTNDTRCAGFGLYTSGSRTGRCCTKSTDDGLSPWPAGTSYTKQPATPRCPYTPRPPPPAPPPVPPVPPAPPSAPVEVTVAFHGNGTFPYNKGAMLESLPGGQLAAACQAAKSEGSSNQRVLVAISPDNGRTWPAGWAAVAPEPVATGATQWEPTLFLAPNKTLWLFWSEGVGAFSLYAATTDARSLFQTWGPRRLILKPAAPRVTMWPLNRIVVVPEDGAWALPCDWGCGGNGHPTGAFVARSTDAGGTWAAAPTIPGIGTDHLCPEPGMALVNDTTMFAVVRSAGVGFAQSWSHDGGKSWLPASRSTVDGAASKPSLVSFVPAVARGSNWPASGPHRVLVLAYNVVDRRRMALSTSRDGGNSWTYLATLDNGTDHTSCYPTTIVVGEEVLTAWSAYFGGPAGESTGGAAAAAAAAPANIRLARTAVPA